MINEELIKNANIEDLKNLYEDLKKEFDIETEDEIVIPKQEEKLNLDMLEEISDLADNLANNSFEEGIEEDTLKEVDEQTGVKEEQETAETVVPCFLTSAGTTLIVNNVAEIKAFQFADNESIKYVSIDGSVKKVGPYAFINCKSLEAVAIECEENISEDKLKTLFKGCDKLEEVFLNDKIVKLK